MVGMRRRQRSVIGVCWANLLLETEMRNERLVSHGPLGAIAAS